MLQELMKGRLCPSPVHMSPAWLATAEGVGSSSPAMTVGWLLLQEALTPHLLPPPAQGLQGSGVRVLLKGLVFSLDPGNTVARALVDPNTDVPCPRRGHPCSPTGWLWGCWWWGAAVSSLLGPTRLRPLRCPAPYVVVACWMSIFFITEVG